MKSEKIAVVGLGYVGLPLALAFASRFPGTIGFDVDEKKIELIRRGEDPTREGFDKEIKESDLTATADPVELGQCSFIVVAVPTPVDGYNRPDMTVLKKACVTVGKVLKPGAVVVFESTVYPSVTEEICGPILAENSGLKLSQDFFIGYSPERINPGDKEHSLQRIIKVVSGDTPATLDRVAAVYEGVVPAGVFRAASIKVAEAGKVIENTQRDLNIALMNELSIIFDLMGIRTQDVLDAASTKWNFVRFTPGLVGGHCIGVDPYYLTTKAEQLGYMPEVILAGRRINDGMGRRVAQKLVKLLVNQGVAVRGARVGILGLTFKENVADIRNSRVPDIVKELDEFGIVPWVYDPMADKHETIEEYGITLSPLDALNGLDALVIAVSHRQFDQGFIEKIVSSMRAPSVIVDVKSVLKPENLPAHIRYWSL